MAPALYLDENVDPEIAVRLRAEGFDILTVQEAGRKGADDDDQLAYAASLGRVVLTHDIRDFGPIAIKWSTEGRTHSGIIYCRRRTPASVCASVRRLFELYSPDQLRNVTMGLPVD